MAESKPKCGNRTRLMSCLARSCTKLVKGLVLHYLSQAKPSDIEEHNWDMDVFLDSHRDGDILQKFIKEKYKKTLLFPGPKKQTNPNHWDIATSLTILELFENIDKDIKVDINHMRFLRNKLFHWGSEEMSDTKFDIMKRKIEKFVDNCCRVIDDNSINCEVKDILKDMNEPESIETVIQTFDTWMKDDILDELKCFKHDLLLLKKVYTIANEILVIKEQCIPNINITLGVNHCNKETTSVVSDILLQNIRGLPPENYGKLRELRDAMDEALPKLLCNRRSLVKTLEACIILTVQCPDLNSLESLLEECQTGKLTADWKGVENILRQLYSNDEMTVELVIANSDYWCCIEELVEQLTTAVHEQIGIDISSQRSPEIMMHPSKDEQSSGTSSEMSRTIKPKSHMHALEVSKVKESGSLDEDLRNISALLADIHGMGGLTIKADLETTESDIKGMADEAKSYPMTLDSDEDKTAMEQYIMKEEATRILKIFRQMAECLEEIVIVEIMQMLSDVMSISITADGGEKDEQLTQVYIRFLDEVIRAGISVDLIAKAIRSFMLIEKDAEGLGKTVSELYLEMIVTDHPSLAIDMNLTDELLKVYFKLLDEGYEEIQHIRLMVVGMFGVGKTTLVRKLCGKPTDDVISTEGIDIFLDSCEVKEDLDWEVGDPKKKEKYLNLRLQELITKYRKQDKKSDTSTIMPTHVPEPTTTKMPSYGDFKTSVTRNDQKQKPDFKIVEELKEIDKKKEEPLKRRPTVSIWDFAGQSVYYSTHHFFLNARSVYILVLDLSKGLHEKVEEDNIMDVHQNLNLGSITKGYTCLETFKFWVKSIYIYTMQKKASSPDNQKDKYKPKIILVGTFKDKISDEMLKGRNEEKYKDDYFRDALWSFKGTQFEDLIHGKTFLISNTCSKEAEFLSIKKEIYNISKGMPFWNEKVPAKFIPLERAVFQHKQKGKHTMKFSELKEVVATVEYPNTDEEIDLFLTFQHAFGNVLYYNMGTHTDQDDRRDLSELIILTPQWIINAFKAFVSHKDKTNEISRIESWHKFETCGQLGNDLIDALLQQNNFLEDRDKILRYMEHLEVIAKPVVFRAEKDKDSCTQSASSEAKPHFLDDTIKSQFKEEDFYIMPCMLPPRPEMNTLKKLYKEPNAGTRHTPTLCMFIKKGLLPAFVLHRIVATAMKEMPIAMSDGRMLLFNGLGSFKLKEKWILTLWSMDNIIHLRVTFKGACKEDEDEIAFCKALRVRFEKLVLEVFNFHGKYTYDETNKAELFSLYVKCQGCDEQVPFDEKKDHSDEKKPVDYMIGLQSVVNLRKFKEALCGCCGKLGKANEALKYWFAIDKQEVDTGKFTQEHKILADYAEDWQLICLAAEITLNYVPRLLTELQISATLYEQTQIDESNSCSVIYNILYHWKKRDGRLETLYNALKPAGIEIENFIKIVNGKDSQMENRIDKCMKDIRKDKGDFLELKPLQIVSLSTCIGKEYQFFGIWLGKKQSEMEQLKLDYRNTKERIQQILTDWNRLDKPIRELVRSVVLSNCDWVQIRKILIDAEAS